MSEKQRDPGKTLFWLKGYIYFWKESCENRLYISLCNQTLSMWLILLKQEDALVDLHVPLTTLHLLHFFSFFFLVSPDKTEFVLVIALLYSPWTRPRKNRAFYAWDDIFHKPKVSYGYILKEKKRDRSHFTWKQEKNLG